MKTFVIDVLLKNLLMDKIEKFDEACVVQAETLPEALTKLGSEFPALHSSLHCVGVTIKEKR